MKKINLYFLIMILIVLFIVLLFPFPGICTDENIIVEWEKTFGGRNYDWANSLIQTTDSGYAVAGVNSSFGAGKDDFWVIKLDSQGNKLWEKTFGGRNYDNANSLIQTTDGGYAVAGETKSFGVGKDDFWVIKLDSRGNKLWDKTYGGNDSDGACSLIQTTDGGYAVAGDTFSYSAGKNDIWVIKLDSQGNKLWEKTFGGSDHDIANSIIQTTDSGYAVAGFTYSYGAGGMDCWVIKFSDTADLSPIATTKAIEKPGKIFLSSTPSGAKIYLDNKDEGETPQTLSNLNPGTYQLKLTKSGYKDYQQKVTVSSDKTTEISAKLTVIPPSYGKIELTSTPSSAKVFLDAGKYMGKTPLTISGILPGKHKVTLVLVNYEKYAQEVDVIADKTVNVSAALVSTSVKSKPPSVGKLVLNSNPSYAQVYLNGIYKGITITSLTVDKLSYGTYYLKLTKAGYEDWTKEIIIYSDKTTEVHAELKPKSGSIYISSFPSGATIYLDGIYKSTTTKTIDNIPSGSHTIKITKTGYEDVTRDIKVIAGKTTALSVNLERILATIEVSSTPSGAKIYLDNIYKGTTPLTLDKLGFGSNHLKLTKSGYQDWTEEIVVSSAKTIEIHVKLKHELGSISISSSPSGGTIYLDGIYKGFTPKTIEDISLGSHTLKITKTGYEDWTKDVEVTAGKTTNESANLVAFPNIELTNIPPGAQIYLDDKLKGTTEEAKENTTFTLKQVPFGKHQIKVTKSGYQTFTSDKDISSSKPLSLPITLKKNNSTIPLLLALILPALAIIYYLFFLPKKEKERKARKEGEKETLEDLPLINEEDISEGITETPPEQDEPLPDDPISREYQEIQEKMEEQAHIRTLLSQAKEKAEKAIIQAKSNQDTARLASLKAISSELDTLSEQFEYGKLSCEDTQKELSNIEERLKKIN